VIARTLVAVLLFASAAGAVATSPPQEAGGSLALAVASFEDVWQTINDTFYDPSFGGVDWPAVRGELLPRARAARTVEEVRSVTREMIGRLGRSHFELLTDATALPGPATVPVDIRILQAEVVVTRVPLDSPAARAGLNPGQVILEVDGVPASSWRPAARTSDERQRDQRHWEAAYRALHGREGTRADLRVREPGGSERRLVVPRDTGSADLLRFGNVVLRTPRLEVTREATRRGRTVGLLAFGLWMTSISESLDRAIDEFREADGLIIDLRGNLGGLMGMVSGLSGHLMAEPVVLGTMRTRAAPTLELKVNPRLSTADGRRVAPFAGPVAILVDEQSASTSEIFAGALQGLGRARVFGQRTMGQALPASTRTLPNGDVLLHAVGDFVTPGGRHVEGAGVVPDELVPLSIAALASGRDAMLEAALAWIDRTGSLLLCSGDLQGTQSLPRWVAPLMRP